MQALQCTSSSASTHRRHASRHQQQRTSPLQHAALASASAQRRPQPFTAAAPALTTRRVSSSSAVALSRRTSMLSMAAAAAAAGSANASAGSHDLLIVGPGVLGSYMGKMWKEQFPGARVVGLTNTTNSHARLTAMGLEPAAKGDQLGGKFPYVMFSAPPSGSQDYAAEVCQALQHWDSSSPSSSFLFTGSMGVCASEDGEDVTDDTCPLVPKGKGPSTDRLLDAEEAVVQAGGNVVRLVGLYHGQRGAHTYFLKVKDVPRWGGYTVNLIHYEDAARISMSILRGEGSGPFRSRIFLGCDNHPITFQAMVDACNRSSVPSLHGEVNWTLPKEQAKAGKRCTNNATRQALGGWTPKYDSFEAFVEQGAQDYYTTSGLF